MLVEFMTLRDTMVERSNMKNIFVLQWKRAHKTQRDSALRWAPE